MNDLLLDVRAIEQLKYRYFRTLDTKRWEEYADCFLPEVTADFAGLAFDGRDALVGYMREHMGPGLFSLHQAHHPEIDVEGDRATGTWYLFDQVIVPEHDYLLEGAAFYEDRYLRTPDGWRIAHTGYRRTFEVSRTTRDLPSWKLTRGTAYDG